MVNGNDNWPRIRIEVLIKKVLATTIDDSIKFYHIISFDAEKIVEGLMGLVQRFFLKNEQIEKLYCGFPAR